MKRRVGIVCALESEAALLVSSLENGVREEKGSLEFFRGNFGENEVIVARCGVGKVFAAMCAEAMILCYQPAFILNSGVAGAVSEALSVGDLCISTALIQHDFDTTAFGDPRGFIGGGIDRVDLPADPETLRALLLAARELGLRARPGKVVSGDVFVATLQEKRRLGREFEALVCEMEGAAIAQVCCANKVPFCAVRSVSDSLTDDSAVEFSTFVEEAARVSARLILRYLEK